jgi:hypothetical protein
MWSVGCILAEVLTVSGNPENGEDFRTLFPGGDEMRQIEMISTVLGKPSQAYIAGISNPVRGHGRPLYFHRVCSLVAPKFPPGLLLCVCHPYPIGPFIHLGH